ncbi:MAG: TRAP transporter fused permease subunit [Actinomycetota bacterium]|nr:TRAP transporter fused permease subunit [Actinomycetota bacterium]
MTYRPAADDGPADRGANAKSGPAREAQPAGEPARESQRDEAADRPTLMATADIPDEAEGERPARRLTGPLRLGVQAVAALLSVYALYNVFVPFTVLPYRIIFLAVVLPLTFLLYRPALSILRRRAWNGTAGGADRGAADGKAADGKAADDGAADGKDRDRLDRPTLWDWLLAGLSIFVTLWPLIGGFDAYLARSFAPFIIDVACGFAVVALVLLATWRTVGPVLPIIVAVFILYAYFGALIPDGWLIGHRGYGLPRLTSQFVMGTEGIFGVPLDVAATYIILFTIYGAVLELSGAGQFFLDISLAAFRKSRTAPGRTVTMAGFLLGTVSGSSTATTVSLGSVAWPILKRAGYPREAGGGVLAAAGIGAILSPPTLGAAAFIIAELLRVSYLEVLGYALIPTLLYYLGIFLAIEFDARRFGVREVEIHQQGFWKLLGRFGYHFSSLVIIVVLLALGQSAFKAVVYATLLAFVLSFLDKRHQMTPPKVFGALAKGSLGVLPVAATCAAAGLIVAVLTITGLGLDLSGIIVDLADVLSGNPTMLLVFTTLFAAIAVILLGLAVPVTASFIIAAVIIAPALTTLGVGTPEAYMFIFYYAVLSEVSPPTALAAVAAAAITGGNANKTMLATWKYTLPAFLVPFAFVLAPAGAGLIADAPVQQTLLVTVISGVAVAALAVVTGKWMFGPAGPIERVLCLIGALALLYLETTAVLIGLGILIAAVLVHLFTRKFRRATSSDTEHPSAQEVSP